MRPLSIRGHLAAKGLWDLRKKSTARWPLGSSIICNHRLVLIRCQQRQVRLFNPIASIRRLALPASPVGHPVMIAVSRRPCKGDVLYLVLSSDVSRVCFCHSIHKVIPRGVCLSVYCAARQTPMRLQRGRSREPERSRSGQSHVCSSSKQSIATAAAKLQRTTPRSTSKRAAVARRGRTSSTPASSAHVRRAQQSVPPHLNSSMSTSRSVAPRSASKAPPSTPNTRPSSRRAQSAGPPVLLTDQRMSLRRTRQEASRVQDTKRRLSQRDPRQVGPDWDSSSGSFSSPRKRSTSVDAGTLQAPRRRLSSKAAQDSGERLYRQASVLRYVEVRFTCGRQR